MRHFIENEDIPFAICSRSPHRSPFKHIYICISTSTGLVSNGLTSSKIQRCSKIVSSWWYLDVKMHTPESTARLPRIPLVVISAARRSMHICFSQCCLKSSACTLGTQAQQSSEPLFGPSSRVSSGMIPCGSCGSQSFGKVGNYARIEDRVTGLSCLRLKH